MTKNIDGFFAASEEFINYFNTWIESYSPAATADHICYKCSSNEEFETLRSIFEHESQFVYQSIISKRRIAVIKFLQPLKSSLGDIWYLELSDQKPDGSQTSGFDHIEVYPIEGSMDALADALASQGVAMEKITRPHHTTYDIFIEGEFKVRIEPEKLLLKIQREEMT